MQPRRRPRPSKRFTSLAASRSAVTSPGPDTKALWECYRAGCTTSAPRRLFTPSRDDSHNRTRTISDDFWLLPEVAAPFKGTERVMAQLKRWRAGATFGLMENKLLSHSLLEALKSRPSVPLIYASSSSVYGTNAHTPFVETDRVEQPASLYAASKRMDEEMAHVYRHLHGLRVTGLRFFTVHAASPPRRLVSLPRFLR